MKPFVCFCRSSRIKDYNGRDRFLIENQEQDMVAGVYQSQSIEKGTSSTPEP